MTQRHPHADLIIAWANGASIQYRTRHDSGWWDVPTSTNTGVEAAPRWELDIEYRIKPANEVRWVPVTAHSVRGITVGYGATTRTNAVRAHTKSRPLLKVLRIEINPDTLELVSATMEAP